ncbi:MAG TPA: TrmH family RNA methyltransferase, partial [Candidatus Saccharimonadia bacterium]|nr:TrmH family RNA methyltransferase [Candidatus Saccharimonadia bacterium]
LLVQADAGEAALVFGNERVGLSNDELLRCHAAVHIPSDPDYGSLNLAAAVQVLAYELRLAALAASVADAPVRDPVERPATARELEGLFGHLERALAAIDFFKGRSPATIMRRLRRLYFRAALSEREVMILRGILADAERMARLAGAACEPGPSGDSSRSGSS